MRSILWFLVGLALASPIENESQSSVQKRSSSDSQRVYNLERTWLGLKWDEAAETCSEEQMDALVDAIKEADILTNYAIGNGAMDNSPSWNRYFLNDDERNLDHTWSDNPVLFKNVKKNMQAVANFPRKGRSSNLNRAKRVTLRCVTEEEMSARCNAPNKPAESKALVSDDGVSSYWTMFFCPYFFDTLKPIDYYASQQSYKEDNLPTLADPREMVIIHELMHCNIIGIQPTIDRPRDKKSDITDVEASPPPFQNAPASRVYGDIRCHGLAWQNKDDKKSIEAIVAGNADNYAWFFVHFTLRARLGWTDDGSTNFHSTKRGSEAEITYDEEAVDINDITMIGEDKTTTTTTGASTTTTPCEVQSYQVATGTEAFCACSTTSGSDTVTSTITTPSGGKCGDYTAFPSTGFMAKPTITADNEMCQFNFGSESKDGYCACQTTVSGSATSQWVPLPYTMGSYTILDCHSITSVDFTSTTSTPTTSATKTFITDYTSEDIGNGNLWVFPTAFATVGTKNWAGEPNFTGVPETLGVGTATFEEVPNYSTTDGLTKYYYAEATGDGNGDVTPVGTPTAVALPSPTQKCIRYTIPDPTTKQYNSDTDQYVFVLYGISAWNTTAGQYEEKISGLLESCGVKDNISVEEDTGKWGTTAVWNSGRHWDFPNCIIDGLYFLGAQHLTDDSCGGGLPNMNENLEVKDSASEDMDYIYGKFPGHVSSPYPLQA